MAFKRKRVYAPRSNAFKKRKTYRKRRSARKTIDYTSLNTRGTSSGFRGKKTSRRTYNRHLWNSTLFTTHYRSNETVSGTITTPASLTQADLLGINLIRHGNNAFWLAAGGAVATDTSVTLPTFKGDVILRGGSWNFTLHNTSAANVDVAIRVFLVYTEERPDFSIEPSTVAHMWDPSLTADWNQLIGKVKMTREVLLESGNNYTISGRLRMQKIDQTTYGLQGRSPLLFVSCGNVGFTTAHTLTYTTSYNLSFSADGT